MTGDFKKMDLRKYSTARVILPESTQCSECGFFDTSQPIVQQLVEEAGRLLSDAICSCQSREE